jgi:hypothetical protein
MNQNILCQNEAEKKLEQPKISENKIELNHSDTLEKIRNVSMKNEWIDIGGVKKWIRKCPECGVKILCPTEKQAAQSTKKGVKCYPCGIKSRRNYIHSKRGVHIPTTEELSRICPKCKRLITYSTIYVKTHARETTQCAKNVN